MSSFEFPGRYYELMRQDFRDLAAETKFLASYAPPGGRVLDLGCGTGTNLRALAALGYQCVGVDRSESFISFAEQAAGGDITYMREPLADFDSEAGFDLVYSIFVTLNYLPRTELPALLSKVRGWLRPGGRFVVDIAHLLNFVDSYQPFTIAHHSRDNVLITRLARQSVNPHRATWRGEETLLVRETDGGVSLYENVFDQSVLTAPELRHLLAEAGFDVVEEFGGFRGEPAPPHGRGPLVFVAQATGSTA